MFDDELFGPSPGEATPAVDDRAVIDAMTRAEVALLRAAQSCGVVPAEGDPAATLERAAAGLEIDPGDLGRRARGAGNAVVPLVKDLLAAVPPEVRPWVHVGATSQDIVDTALMLLGARAADAVLAHLQGAVGSAARLAREHRATAMAGRTLGQVAVPTTFGLKAAGWATGLRAAARDLQRVRTERLAVQLAGAAGTLAVYGGAGTDVVDAFARELGLVAPEAPWHTERSRVRELAAALGSVLAAAGKVATDVVQMATSEVGEVREGGGPGHGGSSAMPHKANPVTSVLVRSAAVRGPGLVATVFAASLQEHERATGHWHAEWQPLRELLLLAQGAAERVDQLLASLDVRPEAVQANLDRARPSVMAEALATRLAPALGRGEAQRVVTEALAAATAEHGQGLSDAQLVEALTARTDRVSREVLMGALVPASALGAVDGLIDRALASLDR
ncbi:lyase family protein [Georgenia sp. SYP-B2076]|uniref:lyase family protein n=1 Tax=Georgenia sp. SYP-B2076 TaxID=2495881 RepID=UPI000F8DADC2|nr:lyase family protein [Georgenia sp. SYP-B2076]